MEKKELLYHMLDNEIDFYYSKINKKLYITQGLADEINLVKKISKNKKETIKVLKELDANIDDNIACLLINDKNIEVLE